MSKYKYTIKHLIHLGKYTPMHGDRPLLINSKGVVCRMLPWTEINCRCNSIEEAQAIIDAHKAPVNIEIIVCK